VRKIATRFGRKPRRHSQDPRNRDGRQVRVLPHIVEAVLNHVSGHRAGVAGIYNRAKYQAEMREALSRWADYVEALLQPTSR